MMISSSSTTSPEAMRQQFFTRADQNGDSKISKEEFAAMAPRDSQKSERKGPSSDEIFSLLDANTDGSIDQTEAENGMKAMAAHRPEGGRRPGGHGGPGGPGGPPSPENMAQTIFQKADGDQNGSLTESELLSSLGKDDKTKDALSKLFADADSDGDGSVTQSDLQQALQKRFESLSTYGRSGSLSPVQASRLSATA